MKKCLVVASVASMIDQFNMNNIGILQELGFEVHVACNFTKGSSCSLEQIEILKKRLSDLNVKYFHINFSRNFLRIIGHIKALRQLKRILRDERYDLIHCHSPIGGMLTRIAAGKYRKSGTRVIYTAHGFHFYKGSPLRNWLIYFPFEYLFSRRTDVLITINKEDFEFAQKHMHTPKVEYVPGVGVNTSNLASVIVDRAKKRSEIGIPEQSFLLISVGELNQNKNHQIIIKALGQLKDQSVHYAIAGQGDQKEYLEELALKSGVRDQLHLLGFRSDVPELYHCSDVCVFPSIREGQGLAAIEGLAVGLPIIASDNRGTRDILIEPENALIRKFDDEEGFAQAIQRLKSDEKLRGNMSENNRTKSRQFDRSVVDKMMRAIYDPSVRKDSESSISKN